MVQEEYSPPEENGLSEAALPDFPESAVSFSPFDGSGAFRTNEFWITGSPKPSNARRRRKGQESGSKDLVPDEQNIMSKIMFCPNMCIACRCSTPLRVGKHPYIVDAFRKFISRPFLLVV